MEPRIRDFIDTIIFLTHTNNSSIEIPQVFILRQEDFIGISPQYSEFILDPNYQGDRIQLLRKIIDSPITLEVVAYIIQPINIVGKILHIETKDEKCTVIIDTNKDLGNEVMIFENQLPRPLNEIVVNFNI